MTYLHIREQGLPTHAIGERRVDGATAEHVDDALRAHGFRAAAQAMAHQRVDLAVALRVLCHSCRRRTLAPARASQLHPACPQTAALPDVAAVPA